jgi:hypothetical protein
VNDLTEYVPDGGGLEELRELRTLASAQVFDLFEFLRLVSDAGFPVFEIKHLSASGAARIVVSYQLNNIVQALLVALRARDSHSAEVEGRSGQRGSLSGGLTHLDCPSLPLDSTPPAGRPR